MTMRATGGAAWAVVGALSLALAAVVPARAASQWSMWGNPVPTHSLIIQPGFHARYVGQPATTAKLDGATFAYGGFWTVTTGYPAALQEVLPSGQVAVSAPLPGAYGGWAVAPGPDDTIWAGTYHKGTVYVYSLPKKTVRTVATIPSTNTVWGMAYDPADHLMWATTFPNGVWTLDPATGAVDKVATIPGEGSGGGRTIAYVNGEIMVGTYPSMNVLGVQGSLLSPLLAGLGPLLGGSGQVEAVGAYGGHVVVLGISGQLVWVGGSPASALGYQTLSDCQTLPFAFDGRTFVVRDNQLVAITPGVAGKYNAVNLPISGPPLAQLPAGKDWSAYGVVGNSFYALSSDGVLVKVTATGVVSQSTPALEPSGAGIIQALAAVPGGVLGSVYLGGEVWSYAGGAITAHTGLDQVDSIEACGDKVYLGVYPGARLYAYVPTQPWNPPANPTLVGSPGGAQDRVPGIACVDGTAYIGTVPQGLMWGGTIFSSKGQTYQSPVGEDTPVSLAADGSLLAGALSNQNALGTQAPAVDAGLFTLNPVTGQTRTVDLGSPALFAGVTVLGGQVFAASTTQIVRWNPATGALAKAPLPAGKGWDNNWGFTTHFFQAGSNLYLIDNGWLYLVDPATLHATKLLYGVQHAAVQGGMVYLTFDDSTWLIQVPAADLTAAAAVWPWNFWQVWRSDGHVWPPPSAK